MVHGGSSDSADCQSVSITPDNTTSEHLVNQETRFTQEGKLGLRLDPSGRLGKRQSSCASTGGVDCTYFCCYVDLPTCCTDAGNYCCGAGYACDAGQCIPPTSGDTTPSTVVDTPSPSATDSTTQSTSSKLSTSDIIAIAAGVSAAVLAYPGYLAAKKGLAHQKFWHGT